MDLTKSGALTHLNPGHGPIGVDRFSASRADINHDVGNGDQGVFAVRCHSFAVVNFMRVKERI